MSSLQQKWAQAKQKRVDEFHHLKTLLRSGDLTGLIAHLDTCSKKLTTYYLEEAYFLACEDAPSEIKDWLRARVEVESTVYQAALREHIQSLKHISEHASPSISRRGLHFAVQSGFAEGVRHLLGLVEVNVDEPDLLATASYQQNDEVFELVFSLYPLKMAEELLARRQNADYETQMWARLKHRVENEHFKRRLRDTTAGCGRTKGRKL